jgi:hypothetical protein
MDGAEGSCWERLFFGGGTRRTATLELVDPR